VRECRHPGCETQPTYGTPGKKPECCAKHKTDEMKNLSAKECQHPGCEKQPSFGIPGKKLECCAEHKTDEMKNLSAKECQHPGCEKRPSYGIPGKKPECCAEHKTDEMKNLNAKECATPFCDMLVGQRKKHCHRCRIHLFPDEPVFRNYKTKERSVSEFLAESWEGRLSWVTDRTIEGGCSGCRPDDRSDLGHRVIIVETDENQHRSYSCESKRMAAISQDLGHRPVVFIRLNPDGYRDGATRVPSCWEPNARGILVVNKDRVRAWNERLLRLNERIEYWSDERTEVKMIQEDRLFYDVRRD
jgi:hypothetical protein